MNPDADQLWRHLRWTLSQVTIYFGVAPAVAPIFGGLLVVHVDWHAIFWLLALIGAALWALNWRLLPETLYAQHRHPFEVRSLMRGYWQLGADPRCLALASGGCAGSSHRSERSWRTGGGRMETEIDEGWGQTVGSRIRLSGRVFGVDLQAPALQWFTQPHQFGSCMQAPRGAGAHQHGDAQGAPAQKACSERAR